MTNRILLYSPDVIGHPRVYCRVIADAITRYDCDVVLAMGFTDTIGLAESADLHPLAAHDRVRVIDNRIRSATGHPHLSAEELVSLQRDLAIDTTLFIEADKSNDELKRIAAGEAPRLHGRNLGIFAKTAEWYPGEDSFTGARKHIIAPTLRTTLGNVKRAIFRRRRTARWFYERVILGSEVLDEILTKLLAEHEIPGAALAVSKDGRFIYSRGFGWADAEHKEPVQPE
ncbi:MAG: serine hydrolase, partial [Thermoanaerobaculia bacterium]